MIIISACLAGEKCRYSGDGFDYPELRKLVEEGKAVPVCPEVLGGAPVPRDPNEIVGGDGFDVLDGRARVITNRGEDKTDVFVRGAREVLAIARKNNAQVALLKERSPSCGSNMIYDGTFSGKKIPGCGCTAALLIREGLQVFSEENYSGKINARAFGDQGN
ncbi:DUF523 domain-containing protein [Desulfoscipio geothermicus]|jgi:uncharacterized protein YbbK (DUF523 family)|uniref:Uncharacterized conserved protein YbbK, DUF523 family n=1 Tax=Desulfoscipio geothermicus DSM 3669 TaxID=1121426 RepID=A0A1I6DQJ3_9FIRM|nr:DUF523 domain-containing protein [Desulfoscipio geothermicus]SFR07743.1 Uncharacterized conserved protein YbbK, DUF523 family [Desulfoscipio geothermicus DSM 3669]